MAIENKIRDIRESKNMSQTDAAVAAGLTFSRYERIESGSPRTTESEIKAVSAALRKCKKLDKKLGGRPFKDPAKQKSVVDARAAGKSVSELLVTASAEPKAPAVKTESASKPAAKKPAAKKPAAKKPAKPAQDKVEELI